MKKAIYLLSALIAVLVLLPSQSLAYSDTLTEECSLLLNLPDDSSSISAVSELELQDGLVLTSDEGKTLFVAALVQDFFHSSKKYSKLSYTESLFVRGDPLSKYSVRLE